MDFETRIYTLEREGMRLLHAGICHDKTKPKYWVQLSWYPHTAYAFGDTLSVALAATERAIRAEHVTPIRNSTITLEDLDLA